MADDVLLEHNGVKRMVPLAERLKIVRNLRYVDAAFANDKVVIRKGLWFKVVFKGGDGKGTDKGLQVERSFGEWRVEIVYFSYVKITSSSVLCRTLKNIDDIASRVCQRHLVMEPAFAF